MVGGRRFLALVVVGVLFTGACGGDDGTPPERAAVPTTGATTTSTTSTPASTTTTTTAAAEFEALVADPNLTPEQQVEAAYLHSWDIYLDAVGHGRTDYLPLAYAETALDTVTGEVEHLAAEGHRAEGAPEHDYVITMSDTGELAVVWDNYVNHLTLIDASTGQPLEADPSDRTSYDFTLILRGGTWFVVGIR